MAELVVLEHTEGAGASAFVEVLDARTSIAPWRAVDVPAGAPLPQVDDELAGLVVMGGTMSATGADDEPWMLEELDLLKRAVGSGVPVLGVCLGAQLLARALGGEVARRATPEIGYLALSRTPEAIGDAVFGGWPDGAVALFLHEDEVTTLPPETTVMLHGSDDIAAWRTGSAVAVQFHPEVDADQLAGWAAHDGLRPLFERAGVDPGALTGEAAARDRVTVPLGRAFVGRFIDGLVRPRAG